MTKFNTNLAAEFHVLAMLHRLGAEALLTLGNKKAVDIIVVSEAGSVRTVDVKGVANKYPWPVDNVKPKPDHFLALMCFLGQIDNPAVMPETFVLPSQAADRLTYLAPISGRRVIPYSRMQKEGQKFRDAWQQLL